jgi:hypothetical protein
MADARGGWSWDVPSFQPLPQPAAAAAAAMPLAPPTAMPRAPPTAMVGRSSEGPPRVLGFMPVADRLDQLADSVQVGATLFRALLPVLV